MWKNLVDTVLGTRQEAPVSGDGEAARAEVLLVINNKGGVGKTTTTVNLAAALSLKAPVLLIDLDNKGNASDALGLAEEPGRHTLARCLEKGTPLVRAVVPSGIPGLDIIQGTLELADTARVAGRHRDGERRLRRLLEPLLSHYAYVLLDGLPTFSFLSRSALIAADHVIVPVVPHYLAVEGLHHVLKLLEVMRLRGETQARLLGILLTMVDRRTRLCQDMVASIRDTHGDRVFETEIPVNVRLAEAPGAGRSIFDHARTSTGARQYWQFSKEVLTRLEALRTDELVVAPSVE